MPSSQLATREITFEKTSDRELSITIVIDAPRDKVFKAYTDPALIQQWWGPRRLHTMVDSMDVRPGGIWRFVQRDGLGKSFAFIGAYVEVVPPRRLVSTFEYEGKPGHAILDSYMFVEHEGKTTLSITSRFPNAEDLDGFMKAGMQAGAKESLERLAELVERGRTTSS